MSWTHKAQIYIVGSILIFQISVSMISSSIVETVVTDVDKATCVFQNKMSIWEPVPPTDEYYILGQVALRGEERPSNSTQLIIAKSINGSLKEPLDFYGAWDVIDGITLWSMRCPDGYVSLSAIASSDSSTKPTTRKYRCVKKEATEEAKIWPDGCFFCRNGYSIRNIYSPRGWRNIFYVIEYPKTMAISTVAYTLKEAPSKSVHKATEITVSPHEEQKEDDIMTKIKEDPNIGQSKKNRKPSKSAPSYTILVISGSFILLILSILTILYFVRSNRSKTSDQSVTASTIVMPYDSAPPFNGCTFSSESNDVEQGDVTRGRMRFLSSMSGKGESSPHTSPELKMKDNVLYASGSWCEMKDNLLYHSLNTQVPEENEYQTICVEPITADNYPPITGQEFDAYSFAN